jgi:hypothetical protein
MQSNPPGMYGNSGTQNNPPGMYGNSGMQSNPPGMYGNSGTQNNPPGMYGNSGMQSNPPGMYGNSGMQWNPEMPRNSINPVSPQSILLAPSRTLSNAAEISQLKLPQTIAKEPSAAIAFLPPINQEQKEIAANSQNLPPKASSKDIALLPPVQPQPTSPNLRTTEPKEPIAELAPKPIDPLVTKQPEKITIDPSQSTTKFPTIPSPSNDTIAKVDPQSLPLTASDKAVDFKVIGQELLHTTSIKIKQFTNQIPPLVSSWSENFRHWLSDRMAAMRANPSPTTSTRETTSYQK